MLTACMLCKVEDVNHLQSLPEKMPAEPDTPSRSMMGPAVTHSQPHPQPLPNDDEFEPLQ